MTGEAKRGKMDWDDGAAWAGALDLLCCAVLCCAVVGCPVALLLHTYLVITTELDVVGTVRLDKQLSVL